jgi:hypothetical protein
MNLRIEGFRNKKLFYCSFRKQKARENGLFVEENANTSKGSCNYPARESAITRQEQNC